MFSIIQAYILLDAEIYLQQHGTKIVETCMYLLSDLRSEGIVMVMRLFESILRSTGNYGVELLRPAYSNIFKYSNLISAKKKSIGLYKKVEIINKED